jgi:hypothetical protein
MLMRVTARPASAGTAQGDPSHPWDGPLACCQAEGTVIAMGRLTHAVDQVCAPLSVDEVAEVLGIPRATAGRWLKALRDDGDLGLWSAGAVEALATYEAEQLGTMLISDALRPQADAGSDPSPREVRRQIDKTDRKNSSLKLELDDLESHGVFDRERARTVLTKTEAAMREGAGQQGLLVRWRQALVRRLRDGR